MRQPLSSLKILLTLVFVLGACGHSRPLCKTVQPGQYFPLGTFSASTEEWYGGQLCAMREEPLADSAAGWRVTDIVRHRQRI
jgi:hypothetical protein